MIRQSIYTRMKARRLTGCASRLQQVQSCWQLQRSGLLIPAYTGLRVIYGHPFETVDASQQEQAVMDIYSGKMDAAAAEAFLESTGRSTFVFYGPRERSKGALPHTSRLTPVFHQGNVTIYSVVPGDLALGNVGGSLSPSGSTENAIRLVTDTNVDLGQIILVKHTGIRGFHLGRCWPLLLPVVLLLPGIAAFPYPSNTARYSDFAISHYPNAVYLRQSILMWHTIPLWSSTILSGYPFAANPLSGLWYLPGWLALIFPLPFGVNMTILLHWLLGGLGMFLLLRAEGLDIHEALFGAVVFEALPKQFAHYGAGHVSLIYAVSWTPWLLPDCS